MRTSTILESDVPASVNSLVGQSAIDEEDLQIADLWYSILRTYALAIRPTLKSLHLTELQYAALIAIHSPDLPRPLTVGGLAECLGVRHNGAVALLNHLCKKGLVSRARCDNDRRAACLRLTGDGRSLLAKLMHADSQHVFDTRHQLERLARARPRHRRLETP